MVKIDPRESNHFEPSEAQPILTSLLSPHDVTGTLSGTVRRQVLAFAVELTERPVFSERVVGATDQPPAAIADIELKLRPR